MTFHESSEFADAIEAAAEALEMRPVLIEKDYWVTRALKHLQQSPFANQVVFKGGTSLSKAYSCIQRFSEDIDLAIIPSDQRLSQTQAKSLLRSVEHATAAGLNYLTGTKLGRNRTSEYDYPKTLPDQDFGVIKRIIKIEVNTFTNPVPHALKFITS